MANFNKLATARRRSFERHPKKAAAKNPKELKSINTFEILGNSVMPSPSNAGLKKINFSDTVDFVGMMPADRKKAMRTDSVISGNNYYSMPSPDKMHTDSTGL